MKRSSEEIRLRYQYRDLILSGKIRLSLESARRLVGPDCPYHLYGVADLKNDREMMPEASEPPGAGERQKL